MKTFIDCLPCIIRQALETSRLSTGDEKIHKKAVDRVMAFLMESDYQCSPPEVARHVYKIINEVTGERDPYKAIKAEYNRLALKMYPRLKKTIVDSADSLLTAIRLAVAGNIIDFGAGVKFDLEETIRETLVRPFAVYDYEKLKDSLSTAGLLLYLGDNAGEIVFDKLLVEEITGKYSLKVCYAVKSEPIINDATVEDAREAGMAGVAEVIENGQGAPGTILDLCSAEFLEIYNNADVIISKGQGNYETLDGEKEKNIFFLLKVKCALIARHLKIKEGDMVLKRV